MPSTSRTAVLAVVLLTALTGCQTAQEQPEALPSPTLSSRPVPSPTESETPATESPLRRYYDQEVDWQPCRGSMRCAEIDVPLDYADPEGKAISLSLLKVPAGSRKQRVGSLVVNPGGPGGSGIEYAANANNYFGPEVRQAFDIVGFDPRGVGQSTPIDCLPDDELDTFVASDPDPDTPAEWARADRMLATFGQGCVDRSGELAGHVSTAEAARDVDIIRGVLGEGRLTWFGASYGTFLGATYAELFPHKVGRMVLDAAIDPTLSSTQTSLAQARGFEVALRAYIGACVDRGDCFLGGSVDEGAQRIRQFLDDVERTSISGDGDRQLEIGNAVLGIWAPLYNDEYWPLLDQALQQAFRGDGRMLLSLSDAYTSRGPDGYVDNSLEALYAVNCLDHDDTVSKARIEKLMPRFDKASPTFGGIFAAGLSGCTDWPVRAPEDPGPLRAKGAEPIVVVGTSRDPATPMAWAEALASQLDSGVLVTRDGDGHGGYGAGNACVDEAVESYLVSGKVPEDGLSC